MGSPAMAYLTVTVGMTDVINSLAGLPILFLP